MEKEIERKEPERINKALDRIHRRIEENQERKRMRTGEQDKKEEEKVEEKKDEKMEDITEQDWVCNGCGKKVQENWKHCKNCGTDLSNEDEDMETKEQPAATEATADREDLKRKDSETYQQQQKKQCLGSNSSSSNSSSSNSSNSSGNNSSSSSTGSNKRNIDEQQEGDRRKIMRTEVESQGNIGMIMEIDSINEKDWEEEKQNLRELKVPFVIIKGLSRKRAMEVSKIQDMFGEHDIWEMAKI